LNKIDNKRRNGSALALPFPTYLPSPGISN
jgi:hypothetical protein